MRYFGCASAQPGLITILGGRMLVAANFWYTTLAPHVTATDHNTFLWGALHGLLLLPNFVYCLFNNSVTIYQAPNTGAGYNFGFLLGVLLFFGGSGTSVRVR